MIWTEYFDLMCKMNGDGKIKKEEKRKQEKLI
jgi:hypothetical protein